MLQPGEVADATLRLIRSDLTGQVLDVRRHDSSSVEAAQAEPLRAERAPERR
jgi:hypothetical protein